MKNRHNYIQNSQNLSSIHATLLIVKYILKIITEITPGYTTEIQTELTRVGTDNRNRVGTDRNRYRSIRAYEITPGYTA